MKTSTKQKLIKALAAAFILTAAGGTVFAINSISNDKVETPFNGIYNGTLTAFAEETSTEGTGATEGTESATQVGNLVLKKMISVNKDYMLVATRISNVTEYKELGYYITENGVTKEEKGNTYYTGIQVKTDKDGGTKTYDMSEIYGAEYSYENAGMIVCEVPYTESAEYVVKPYLVKNDNTVVYGANGYKEGTNPYVLKNGSFEKGNLDGWERSVEGLGNVSDAIGYWGEALYNKDGNYLFSAYTVKNENPIYDQGGDEGATGTLTSSPFTLGGSGWISFKLGAAKNGNQVCLEVIKVENEQETVVARYYNSEWKEMTLGEEGNEKKCGCTLNAYRADLSAYLGSTLKIRVTDHASTDYGLFFLDSVQTYHEEVPTTGVEATNIIDYVVDNGGFETGNLDGWTYEKTTEGDFGYVSEQDVFWKNNDCPYNKDGKYLFSGVQDVNDPLEDGMGKLTSSPFKVGGSYWITFKLGGGLNYGSYISVVDAESGAELTRYRNTNPKTPEGTMVQYKANLSAYRDNMVKIVVNDITNYDGIWRCLAVDSFFTYYENEPEGTLAENCMPGNEVFNGGFENDLNGWTVVTTDGPENQVFGAIGNADATWGENRSYNNDGKFFQNMNEGCKGYLISSAFKVSDNGWMTFKLGGNKAFSYVSIIDAKTGEELAKFVNEQYVGAWPNNGWEMYSYKVNLIESGIAAGTEVRIKVVDGATNDYGVVVVDSFVTYYANEPEGNFQKIEKV